MRNIKFRVWVESVLEKETGMYTPDYISSWQNGTNWDIDKVYTKDGGENGYKFKEDTCKFTMMQYTGLKDKNGAEIYEGDLIYLGLDDENVVIEYHDDRYVGRWLKSGFRTDLWQLIRDNEVIGNIYENPELLED